jgi:hypothetical protein
MKAKERSSTRASARRFAASGRVAQTEGDGADEAEDDEVQLIVLDVRIEPLPE